MEMLAAAWVASVTVRLFTVIPAPKLATEVPCTKWVKDPVRATEEMVAPCCPLFGLTVVSTGVPLFVSEKFTVVNPEAVAATEYDPDVPLAVNVADATPDAPVITEMTVLLLLNFPEAPELGAVNVTVTPDLGLLTASFTVTESALVNAVLTFADWGVVPGLADIWVAVPARLVSEKLLPMGPAAALML
jgi:hypothetical protein